ncbi:MAG: carbon-nitrogen hydrolase family protein [Armatimonadota bacterium]|jgi:N-carbamoylputrescine amidase
MEDFRAAAVQMNAPLGEVEANLDRIESYAGRAVGEGARLVCFPELAISGHWCSGEIWGIAEPVPDGPSCRRLEKLAWDLGCYLSVGIAEREAGVAYNTQMIIGPEGFVGKQRKLHMSADEYFHFRMGASINVVDIGLCRLGIGICYDTVFPETARIAAIKGAEVYLAPHAARCGQWIDAPEKQRNRVARVKSNARMTFRSRAWDNGMFVIYCNQAGHAGSDTNHCGGVLFIDPSGDVLAESQTELIEDEIVLCDLEAELFDLRRRARCFNLQTRRPEIYGEICRMSE